MRIEKQKVIEGSPPNPIFNGTSSARSLMCPAVDQCLPENPLSNDDMIDGENAVMLGRGGGDTNVDEGGNMVLDEAEEVLVHIKLTSISGIESSDEWDDS
eukprot:11154467-Ditylum_brightwellii.AAC.1